MITHAAATYTGHIETIIAKLEEGSVGVAFGSRLAAIDAVVKLLKAAMKSWQ